MVQIKVEKTKLSIRKTKTSNTLSRKTRAFCTCPLPKGHSHTWNITSDTFVPFRG